MLIIKVPKFKIIDRVRIVKFQNIFNKGYTEKWLKEIFVIDSVLKTNPQQYKTKDIKAETIIGVFYEMELLLIKSQMTCYLEPDSYIRDNVKVVLDLSNYATKQT